MRLAELIQAPEFHDQAAALLKQVADDDLIGNLQKLAKSVLEHDSAAGKARSQPERQHIFAVSCPACQRISYYDKREVAGKSPIFMGPESALDQLILNCTHCGKPIKVSVDLEGYK